MLATGTNHGMQAAPAERFRHTATRLIIALALLLAAADVAAQEHATVTTVESRHDFADTRERLESAIEEEGLTLITTIDHAANAESAGMELPPTTLFLFGNPQVGTPLMQAARTVALDLPQKMLVWQDHAGDVFVSFRDPVALAADHGLAADEGALPNVADLLGRLARIATGGD